jgi:ubiquitin carboxyl-terminal hydrolase 10
LSPQEELAKLLIDGVPIGKGKAKEGTLTLPRGLINTGNMCFANTVSPARFS